MLDKKDKYHLRSLANTLNPIVTIGKDGLTQNVLSSIIDAITAHELIKISILKTYQGLELKELASLICNTIDAELIFTIGRVIVIYKKNKELNRYGIK